MFLALNYSVFNKFVFISFYFLLLINFTMSMRASGRTILNEPRKALLSVEDVGVVLAKVGRKIERQAQQINYKMQPFFKPRFTF
ncbi:hypothetical protein Mgra_00007730 [Meloidogyne graminicola]|uniref:Uncharacterized protein n=1 Tax=Meloidogyne graminicola TaxID=189291 RepID=A0A8S9ZHP2_9BILA|nr:hypothetical protein Mgra_00007730 [Meloidogyne graminicola]